MKHFFLQHILAQHIRHNPLCIQYKWELSVIDSENLALFNLYISVIVSAFAAQYSMKPEYEKVLFRPYNLINEPASSSTEEVGMQIQW